VLTWGLGLLWLLDAALQYQPYMFTRAFPNDAIAPAGQGSPSWVSAPVSWAAHLMAGHIVLYNTAFATVQLAIAIGLFLPATVRIALAASVVWSLLIWWLGEGLGGVLSGAVSPLMGLPGAVLIYAFVAVLVWPPRPRPTSRHSTEVAYNGLLSLRGARGLWLLLWGLFAFEAIRPANRAPGALRDLVAGMSDGEPSWLASLNAAAARALGHNGTQYSIALALACGFIAVSVYIPKLARAGVISAIALALAIWIVGEDMGAITTGTSTDPNSGLPLVLFALCYWPLKLNRTSSPHLGRAR
jgi:hypothetical protein